MPKTENNTLEILRNISSVVSQYAHDGARDKETQKPIEMGLNRDTQDFVLSTNRTMDGFNIKLYKNILCIKYQSEMKLKDVHDKKFETNVENKIEDIVKFLKKQYKKEYGKALTLTPIKKSYKAVVQHLSNVRSWVFAYKEYTIGGVEELKDDKPKVDKAIENWLTAAQDGKKPANVSADLNKNKKENY